MTYITRPSELSPGVRYFVHRDTSAHATERYNVVKHEELVRFILEAAQPDAEFLGYCDHIAEPFAAGTDDGKSVVVTVDPKAPRAMTFLPSGLRDRVIMMPIPATPGYLFWVVGRILKGVVPPPSRSGRLELSQDNMFRILVGLRALELEGAGVARYSKLYPCLHRHTFSKEKIDVIRRNLGDQESRDAFDRAIHGPPEATWQAFFTGIFSNLEYMDYVRLGAGDVILDGGIFNGWEYPYFINALEGYGKIYGIDPDGHDNLELYVRDYIEHCPDIFSIHRMALWNQEGELVLPSYTQRSVPCQTVDTFVRENGLRRLDYMKFDLEGAEIEVMTAMIETIRHFRPQVGIAIYHEPNHFVDIPYFLMNSIENYEFYMKSYNVECQETILYCIPRERLKEKPRGLAIR